MQVTVRQATSEDLNSLTTLFDGYRQFYGQGTDLEGARRFLSERFQNDQSVVFLVEDDSGKALGFTQLYPSFSSVSMARTYILNDLFVVESSRRKGVASKLLQEAAQYSKTVGAIRLTLSTAVNNHEAQALYTSEGWELDQQFLVFHKKL